MSTAFIEDDGDPVLRPPQHLSESSTPSHGRLAACVLEAAVPRQMQDVPAYGGMCRRLHKNCEQRVGPIAPTIASSEIPPISRPISGLASHPCEVHAEHRGLRGVHLPSRPPILLSLQREASWRRSSCLDLTSFALMPSKNSKTCQTSRTEWRMFWSYSVLLGFSHSQLMIGSDPKHTNCASQQTARLINSILKIHLHYHLQYSRSIFFNSWNRQDQQQFDSLSLLALWHQPRCFLAPFSSRAVSCSWCSHFTLRIFTETTPHT